MIYFDNASTSRTDDLVIEEMIKAYKEYWANPSSLHSLGFEVEKKIKESRKVIANELNVSDKFIYFTPSGTIGNNTVLNSFNQKGKNIIVSKVEHKSILNKLKHIEAEIRYANVYESGRVNIDDLVSKVDENTILVSIMHVNNELGTINYINEISRRVKEKNRNVVIHSDGIQAFKKIDISLDGIDIYSIASHKINGPKGIAALYIKDINVINPLYFGGGQEKGLFSGTENTQSIIGFAKACTLDNNYDKIIKINNYIREAIKNIKGSKINSPDADYSPFILNVGFNNIGSEILLHYLEMDEIYISTGSACSKTNSSYVLEAIGVTEEYIEGCIRISFSRNSTMEEAKEFVVKLNERIEIIRRILG